MPFTDGTGMHIAAKALLPPGPPGRFLIGTLPMLEGDALAKIENWARVYGDIFFHRAFGLPLCYLTSPDFTEDVLVTRNHCFVKGMGMRMNPLFFGEGLLTSEGELWRRQRHLMQPAFHRRQIGRYAQVMVECTARAVGSWRAGDVRDLHAEMDHLTLEIIARVLFNLDLTNYTDRLERMARALQARVALGPAVAYALRYLPTPRNLRYFWSVRRLEKVMYRIIRRRRESGCSSDDLLSMLLQVRDEHGRAMSERQVRDELMTLIGAGNDTTTLTLSYAGYLLARHPDIEARLRSEVDDVLGGRAATAEDLSQLSYTEKVIKETLRLYPPVWAFVREATEPFEIGGYRLPARTNFVLCPWVLHRDGRYFDRPSEFDPDRWTEEFERQLPKFAYFPFGGGQRTCIGAPFARMQTTLILATLAQRIRFSLLPGFNLELQPSITLQPKKGIPVVIEERFSRQSGRTKPQGTGTAESRPTLGSTYQCPVVPGR